jgi:hypothetical protein
MSLCPEPYLETFVEPPEMRDTFARYQSEPFAASWTRSSTNNMAKSGGFSVSRKMILASLVKAIPPKLLLLTAKPPFSASSRSRDAKQEGLEYTTPPDLSTAIPHLLIIMLRCNNVLILVKFECGIVLRCILCAWVLRLPIKT